MAHRLGTQTLKFPPAARGLSVSMWMPSGRRRPIIQPTLAQVKTLQLRGGGAPLAKEVRVSGSFPLRKNRLDTPNGRHCLVPLPLTQMIILKSGTDEKIFDSINFYPWWRNANGYEYTLWFYAVRFIALALDSHDFSSGSSWNVQDITWLLCWWIPVKACWMDFGMTISDRR